MSTKLIGKTINTGNAFGYICVKRRHTNFNNIFFSIEIETLKYKNAKRAAIKDIQNKMSNSVITKEELEIYEIQLELLQDTDFDKKVLDFINQEISVVDAINKTKSLYFQYFINQDESFVARFDDIESICNLLINIISYKVERKAEQKIILYGEKIYPLDILHYRKNIVACVSKLGSPLSHTSILCKTIGIPYLINIDLNDNNLMQPAFVNGDNNCLILDPKKSDMQQKQTLNSFSNLDDSYPNLSASITDLTDITCQNYGIGLYRTEFMYMKFENTPTQNQQIEQYTQISNAINNKPLTIRTLDITDDKTLSYLKINKKINKEYRSIKISLDNINLFKDQIKAILISNTRKNISILFPFINTEQEIKQILNIVNECKKELTDDNINFNNVKIGAMIETPTGVSNCNNITKYVDFISIGTNDLTQYIYNIDRENEKQSITDYSLLLESIKTIAKNAHNQNKKVCICGEMASDLNYMQFFKDNNIDELVIPFKLLTKK